MAVNIDSLAAGKKEVLDLLQKAFELELSTIPPYLVAVLSIKPKTNRIAAKLIHSVMMEEMLHMLLVGNLITALGGNVVINENTIPSYPLSLEFNGEKFKDRQFDVHLAPFSKDSLDVFLQIELPQEWPEGPAIKTAIPGYTIGEFYKKIEKQLEDLCAKYGEKTVFSSMSDPQLNEGFYWGGLGTPIVVKGLDSAKEALKVIVDQGEGAWELESTKSFSPPGVLSHFYRFRQIYYGKMYQAGDDPQDEPTGETFEVDFNEVFPIIANPKSTDYLHGTKLADLNSEFNRNYTLMLTQIGEAINTSPTTLYTAIMNGMHGLMPTASQMVSTPIEGDQQGRHGAPSFEWMELEL